MIHPNGSYAAGAGETWSFTRQLACASQQVSLPAGSLFLEAAGTFVWKIPGTQKGAFCFLTAWGTQSACRVEVGWEEPSNSKALG